MNRRHFLALSATATTTALAGCSAATGELLGAANMEWDGTLRRFVGQGLQPTAVVTGQAENTGDNTAGQFYLTCRLLDQDGAEIVADQRRLDEVAPGERQQYYFVFELSRGQMERLDDFTVDGAYEHPDAE